MFKGKKPYVVLYANRRAGWRHERWWALDKWALEEGIKTYALTEIEEIIPIIEKFSEQIRLLLVYGGDGTLFHITNSLLKQRNFKNLPIIVPVGGGTMNRLRQWSLWIGEPIHNAKIALELFESKRLPQLPLPLLEVRWGENCYRAITFMAGVPVRVMHKYSNFKTTPFIAGLFVLGALASGILSWPKFFTGLYDQIDVEITVDGKKLPNNKYLVVIKDVLRQLIFFAEPYRGACSPVQSFSLAYAIDYKETAQKFLGIFFGRIPQNDERYFNQPSAEMKIMPREEIPFTLDGEYFSAKKDEIITISPGPIVPVAANPMVHLPFLKRLFDQKDRFKELLSYVLPTKKQA